MFTGGGKPTVLTNIRALARGGRLPDVAAAFGIDETKHVIEHADLATAGTRSTTLWGRQPINHQPPPGLTPPQPKRPMTRWFGQAARRSNASPTGAAHEDLR